MVLPVGQNFSRDGALRLEEAAGLARALDLEVASARIIPLRAVRPNAYFGGGRIEELKAEMELAGADVLIVDAALTPVQQRNLERDCGVKVVDRSGLILEIFGRRAQSREGRLQVELARLAYERSRLVRTWTHLERQRGGLGKTGGPGETQIELDRRIIAQRIDRLKREIDDVRRTRGLQRRARKRAGLPMVALVGYTNAGKSTLFNRLSAAGVLAKDMPFATLDPTTRAVRLPSGRLVALSDTVGFITDLPTELVASFRSTLEEVSLADVLVHVRDIAHPETDGQSADVEGVLDQLEGGAPAARIEVWNKMDRLTASQSAARLARAEEGDRTVTSQGAAIVPVSAQNGDGIEKLLEAIDRLAFGPLTLTTVTIDPADGRRRAAVAAAGRILDETLGEDGLLRLTVEAPASQSGRLVDPSSGALAAE